MCIRDRCYDACYLVIEEGQHCQSFVTSAFFTDFGLQTALVRQIVQRAIAESKPKQKDLAFRECDDISSLPFPVKVYPSNNPNVFRLYYPQHLSMVAAEARRHRRDPCEEPSRIAFITYVTPSTMAKYAPNLAARS